MYRQYCRLIGCACIASLLCVAAANATTSHPDDPNAALEGSFKVQLPLPLDAGHNSTVKQGEIRVWFWRTAGGRVDYVIDIDSIRFAGDCSSLDTTVTIALFEAISRTAVSAGITSGHSACNAPQTVGLSRVYHGSCMTRTGTGSGTVFSHCAGENAYREYQFYCGDALPTATLTRIFNPYDCGSSSGCETAYPFSTMESGID